MRTPSPAVRNVALVGHTGSGRTTLARALGGRGAGPWLRRAQDGVVLNLLDDPALLPAAEAALFVVASPQGLDAGTAALWEECAERALPRVVCVTQLDLPRADFDETVAVCRRVLGEAVHPLLLPMLDDAEQVAGSLGLLDLRVHDWSAGARVERAPDPQHVPLVEGLRADLVEAVLADSDDDSLLDRYLDGEPLDPAVLAGELATAVARGGVHPVVPVVAARGVGLPELLDLLGSAVPPPAHGPAVLDADGHPAAPPEPDPTGPLLAEPLPGGLVRVWSGTLRGDLRGPDGERWTSCPAGDLCVPAPGTPLTDPGLRLTVAPRTR